MNPIPKLLEDSTKVAQTAATSIGQNYTQGVGASPITPESLQGSKPYTLPGPKPETSSSGLIATIEGLTAQAQANIAPLATNTTQKKADSNNLFSSIVSRLTGNKGKTQLSDEAYSEAVDPAQKELNDINAQINAKTLGYRREIEALQKDGRFTKEQVQPFIAEKERQAASELADLSIIQMAKQNNYSTAKEIADRKVSAQLEKDQNELEALKFFYTENKADLDKEDDRNFNLLINERERLLGEQSQEKKNINAFMLTALQNGAPASVAQAIGKASSYEEALRLGAGYANDPLDREYKGLQIRKLRQDINEADNTATIAQSLNVLAQNGDSSSAKEALAGIMGNKAISAGTKGRISPVLSVLNAVDDFSNANQEGAFTGIGVGGRIKEFFKGLVNAKSSEAINNAQNIEAINLKVQQWASGAALTEAQTKQVDRLTPTKNDSDRTVRSKLSGLYNFMLNQAEGDLLSEGVNVSFKPVNLFEIYDLYQKASPEQRKFIEDNYFNK